ncbi:MAG: outer membrane lipoprotein-sorting protein, partial [Candidatus Obscuribacterales bacterium]|nr:outer membrane lipoprotein-sorting protein [Steroidobacteraceae bacterium]
MSFMFLRCAVICIAVLATASVSAQPESAADLMSRNFVATKVSGFNGEVTMSLINARGEQRVRKMLVRSKLRDNGLDSAVMTRFAQPADIRGTGFLQVENSAADDDIWVYLPGLKKTRRLAANNKRDSFFGTDFSNGDILLPVVDKYRHELLRNVSIDGNDCYVIESTPSDDKTREDTGYSRRVTWVDAKSYVERRVEYYDLNNKLLKTQLTADIREVEPNKQRWMPMSREMTNHLTSHKTLYRFDRFAIDKTL